MVLEASGTSAKHIPYKGVGPMVTDLIGGQVEFGTVVVAFADPVVKDTMAKHGNTINISSSEQAQAAFRSELAKYAALVKKVGLEPQ